MNTRISWVLYPSKLSYSDFGSTEVREKFVINSLKPGTFTYTMLLSMSGTWCYQYKH